MSRETFKKAVICKDTGRIIKETWNMNGRHYEKLYIGKDGIELENPITTYTSDEPLKCEMTSSEIIKRPETPRFNPGTSELKSYLIGRVMDIETGEVFFKSTEIPNFEYIIKCRDIINLEDVEVGYQYKSVVLEEPSYTHQKLIQRIECFPVVE